MAGSSSTQSPHDTEQGAAGFSTIDERGRVVLPKAVRETLAIHAGSSLAYVVVENGILLIPQDRYLVELQRQAMQVMADTGLTVQDMLDRLPQAQIEVMREAYGADFLAKLKQLREDAQQSSDEPNE